VGLRAFADAAGQYSFSYPNGMIRVDAPKREGAPVVLLRDLVFEDEGVNLMVADFDKASRIDELGDIQAVGLQVADKILAPPGSNRTAKLLNGGQLEQNGKLYYIFEFASQVGNFPRHDVVAVTIDRHRLFTLTASTSEQRWPKVNKAFYEVAQSLRVG
jgi:photosystem II oxygen-evolving enhancer protein 2